MIKTKPLSLVAATLAATLFALPAAAATTVADSILDYTVAAQGVNGWYYGWAKGEIGNYASSGFNASDVPATGSSRWYEDPDKYWTQVYDIGAHPNGKMNTTPPMTLAARLAVRRWVAPVAGTYRIAGQVQHVGGPGSDGVSVSIVRNATTLWAADVATLSAPLDYSLKVTLSAGQSVDFVLGAGAGGDDIEDATNFNAIITTGK